MATVYEIPKRESIDEQASLWVARLDRGLNAGEQSEFVEWLQSNDSHRQCFFEMARLWDRMDLLQELATIVPLQVKPRGEAPMHGQGSGEPSVANAKPRRKWLLPKTIAASFVALACMLGTYLYLQPESSPPEQVLAQRYYTELGEQSTVQLSDGSELRLNTQSSVSVVFSAQSRIIHLEYGEMGIDVAHNHLRPLLVKVNNSFVRAVGTAFNLQTVGEDYSELIVTEGEVVVGHIDQLSAGMKVGEKNVKVQFEALRSGQAGDVHDGMLARSRELSQADIKRSLSWREGRLIFTGETLREAVDEISRYSAVEFVIQDPVLENLQVAGVFKTGDVEGLILNLAQNLGVDANRSANGSIILRSKNGQQTLQ